MAHIFYYVKSDVQFERYDFTRCIRELSVYIFNTVFLKRKRRLYVNCYLINVVDVHFIGVLASSVNPLGISITRRVIEIIPRKQFLEVNIDPP